MKDNEITMNTKKNIRSAIKTWLYLINKGIKPLLRFTYFTITLLRGGIRAVKILFSRNNIGDELACIVDKIYVISLPNATERRTHIKNHFLKHGIKDFTFFDAIGIDDDSVAQAYADDRVTTFPPCFRCKKISCGKEDCNNFLVKAQVAVWITYTKLWKMITQNPENRILIVEDDVFFHSYASEIIRELNKKISNGNIYFSGEEPSILRLGSALSDKHSWKLSFSANQDVVMCNPCHAITKPFAELLLKNSSNINTTVDIFQHEIIAPKVKNYTIKPQIASELSWSTGQLPSLIHPKINHIEHLKKEDLQKEAKQAQELFDTHISHMFWCPLLMIGHPRCGSGYAANLCRQLGLNIGHEQLEKDGISSWMFAVDDNISPYALNAGARTRKALSWRFLLQHVRSLEDAIPSIIRENENSIPSLEFRRKHILAYNGLDIATMDCPIEQAIFSLVSWSRMIDEQQPNLIFRIEDESEKLINFLVSRHLLPKEISDNNYVFQKVNADKKYQGRHVKKTKITPKAYYKISEKAKREVIWYCNKYGYKIPSSINN